MVLHDLGRLEDAVAEYREAKRLAPQEPNIRNNLGNTYYDKGDYDAAISEFRELFRMAPEWQHGHDYLAKSFMAKKDYPSAISELKVASAPESHRGRGASSSWPGLSAE